MNGKGSKPRPIKNIKNYISNWEDINWSTTKNPYDGSTLDSFLKQEQGKKAYLETSKGRRVYLDEKPNKSS